MDRFSKSSKQQQQFLEGKDLGSSFAPLSQAKFTVGISEPKCKFLLYPLGITAFCSALNIITNNSGVP